MENCIYNLVPNKAKYFWNVIELSRIAGNLPYEILITSLRESATAAMTIPATPAPIAPVPIMYSLSLVLLRS